MFGKKKDVVTETFPLRDDIEALTTQIQAQVVSDQQTSLRVEKALKNLTSAVNELNSSVKRSSGRGRSW